MTKRNPLAGTRKYILPNRNFAGQIISKYSDSGKRSPLLSYSRLVYLTRGESHSVIERTIKVHTVETRAFTRELSYWPLNFYVFLVRKFGRQGTVAIHLPDSANLHRALKQSGARGTIGKLQRFAWPSALTNAISSVHRIKLADQAAGVDIGARGFRDGDAAYRNNLLLPVSFTHQLHHKSKPGGTQAQAYHSPAVSGGISPSRFIKTVNLSPILHLSRLFTDLSSVRLHRHTEGVPSARNPSTLYNKFGLTIGDNHDNHSFAAKQANHSQTTNIIRKHSYILSSQTPSLAGEPVNLTKQPSMELLHQHAGHSGHSEYSKSSERSQQSKEIKETVVRTNSPAPGGTSSSVDIHRISEQVYKFLEQRIKMERERKGF